MLWLIILLAIITIVSITLFILTKIEIKNMTYNLREINSINTNKKLMLSSPGVHLEGLAKEINKTIEQRHETEILYRKMDTELRQAIANISHDLRTPLTSIIGYIQLMKSEALTAEERNRYAEIVLKRAKSLNILLTGFFDLSRLEAGEYGFKLEPLYIYKILCELMASSYDDFKNKDIEPEISIDETAPEVIGDETAIRRVFTNLIQNALKYGNKFISVSLKQEGAFITTTFTNDAPDLTEDDAAHLFERFFTASRTRNGQNTGLGLAITKELVENLGGDIISHLAEGNLDIIIKWPRRTGTS